MSMDFTETFGETRQSRSGHYDGRTVRHYKGVSIPWSVHDCDGTESCSYCRMLKREFIAQVKTNPVKP